MTIAHELKHDHSEIEQLAKQLGNAVESCDFGTIQQHLGALDRELRRHFEGEERYLLPKLQPTRPGDVEIVKAQHRSILKKLDAIGMDAELHTLRKHRVDELVTLLRDHVATEEECLYHWAEDNLRDNDRKGLLAFLRKHLPGQPDAPRSSQTTP